ncbi:MAG: mandelate racemase [Rhodospirillales bacterium]|nr:mandelate racemase [Rhodospirillales bacterium]
MRFVEIRQRSVPISRYADPSLPSGGLTTSIVALVTDVRRDGAPVVGYGFSSIGRFAQGGLIRDRFAPRLLALRDRDLATRDGTTVDPFRVWAGLMAGEKPGGHGERCVAVGTLDMAVWDAAAKIAELPLYRFLAEMTGEAAVDAPVPVYAGGGYYFPEDDEGHLREEIAQHLDRGFTHVKIKIGGQPLGEDLARVEAALDLLPDGGRLAVDALNAYGREAALKTARHLSGYGLRWFEDVCDPLDYETHAEIARLYSPPIAAGEALFSLADARNLVRYAGLRPGHDVLVFDPVHCYGLPEYLRILKLVQAAGWSRRELQPHGGHLFSLHVAAALGLGGCEANPHNFQPFGGFADNAKVENGRVRPPAAPGIGFETRGALAGLFHDLATSGVST